MERSCVWCVCVCGKGGRKGERDGDRREKRERKERIEGGKREKGEGEEKKKGRKSVFVQPRAQNLKCSNQNPYS